MQVTEGKLGRVFILRLENDNIVPECIEKFATEYKIEVAQVILLGGIYKGDIIVGPRETSTLPPEKMTLPIETAHETLAIGLIAPDKDGNSILHMHGALGRAGATITGCYRNGLNTWLIAEVVITEILNTTAKRLFDENSGLDLLKL